MYNLVYERDPATEFDVYRGRVAQKALLEYYNKIDTKGSEIYFLNENKDNGQLFDFLAYNKKMDFALPFEVEGKDRELFDKLLLGYNTGGEFGFESIHFANKRFYDLKTEEIRNSFKHIIDRSLRDDELNSAMAIMIPLDADKKLDFGFKININKSIYRYYDFLTTEKLKSGKEMFFNSRRIIKDTQRKDASEIKKDFGIEIPFKEVKLNDYRF
jgi:hypothetical protein